MDRLIDLALAGIRRLGEIQERGLAGPMADVEAVLRRGERKPAEPKNEAGIWGRP